jgi:hypothetical protein
MSIHRNKTVQPLEEGLKEIGLDPEQTIGQIQKTTDLINRRMDGGNGGGAPGYTQPQQPPKPPQGLREVSETPQGTTPDPTGDGEDLDEAVKVVKRKRVSMFKKMMAKRSRKKRKGKLRRAAKMYYKKFKKKIAKRAKIKLKKFGKAGLAKLHKMGKMIRMSDDNLANLREDLNTGGGSGDNANPFEEAAFNAGMLALYLGEIFEAAGDIESAETMYDVSDAAADLSEAWDTLAEDDELDEDQEAQLERVLDSTIKALRVYEGMGAPSLMDVIEATEDEPEATDQAA